MSREPKFPSMPARLDPFGREKPKTEIVGVFESKSDARLHTYGCSEADRYFVRDTGVEPSWLAGFEAGLVWGAAIVAMAEAIRGRETPGERINRRASIGAEIVALKRQISEQEKIARRTPPKTLALEWKKVRSAQLQLPDLYTRLWTLEADYEHPRMRPPSGNQQEKR